VEEGERTENQAVKMLSPLAGFAGMGPARHDLHAMVEGYSYRPSRNHGGPGQT
jgi:hypothetical protein